MEIVRTHLRDQAGVSIVASGDLGPVAFRNTKSRLLCQDIENARLLAEGEPISITDVLSRPSAFENEGSNCKDGSA